MVARETLSRGVELGIITADQAERLRALEAGREPPELPASPDDEQLRFIGGFSDIFVAIGLAMFLGAVGYFAARSAGQLGMWIATAVTAWLLAEFFTRLRRMALPSIVLLIVFAVAAFKGTSIFLGAGLAPLRGPSATLLNNLLGLDPERPTLLAAAAFLTVMLVALHYWRFRVPITIAAGCAAMSATVVALVYALAPELPPAAHGMVILACGLAIFALAMRFDISDPQRLTRRTDIAFWLHLLAAPLVVHSLIDGMVDVSAKLDPAAAVAVMVVFLGLSIVAVLIDRRAMLVSGLAYAGVAFWTLISEAGLSDITTPLTILALGAFVLLLSAGWRPLRAGILSAVPAVLARRLPQADIPQTSLSA
jgi:hypothetical protein